MKLITPERLGRFKTDLENTYGQPGKPALLDSNGKVLESEIPSSAFNVLEYASVQDFPVAGEAEKLYLDTTAKALYHWDGNGYVSISDQDSVKFTSQSLTNEQKAQARTNIGALDANDLPEDILRYSSMDLTNEQKVQSRANIDAASTSSVSSLSSTVSNIEALIQTYSENVADITKIENGIRVLYADGTSKEMELETDFPIKSVVYDENHYLHFYDANNNDLFDNVYIEGGGGGGGSIGSVTVARITAESSSCVYGSSFPIQFTVTALDASGDAATLKGSTWTVGGVTVARNIPVINGNNTFDIGPYLNAGDNTIKIVVTADTGGDADVTASKTWRVNAVNMRFTWNYNDTSIHESSFTDSWTVYGEIEKTSHSKLGNTELPVTVTTKTNATQSISIPMQPHGAYGLERWVTASIGGQPQSTPHEYHEVIFVESGNPAPIIAVSMKDTTLQDSDIEMDQYDTIEIPVVIYDPMHILTDATLTVDGEYAGEWENIDRSTHLWAYTPTTSGPHTLAITCGETVKTLVVNVNEVALDIEEVSGYTFRFKSSEFASNKAVREWESNGITASFSDNFDWVNGGLKTERDDKGNLQQYFCIKAGTRMTINHKLFAVDPKESGMTFKIIYKVRNCRNYDALVGHCFSDVGIRMNAHNATFNSSGTTINVPYGEDEYIELEFDVYPSNNYHYMMAWIDGVITSCRVYDANDNFVQNYETRENIVLGSDDCDVYIYMVKTYPMLVDRDGHIDNFIMDAPNASEMAKRYSRNDILNEGGDIDYEKLVDKNPDCRVWLYDIPYLTNDKSNKVDDCKFNQFWKNGSQYYQMSGIGTMSVQGTSSVHYIRGAANTDINFTSLSDGNDVDLLAGAVKDKNYGGNWFIEDSENPGHAKVFVVDENTELTVDCVPIERDANRNVTKYVKAVGMKLNDDSCPITYSNTKVNFASCEQVNNMCNAKWYQMYNPYPSLTARDCMEFNMGVQFIKDSGEIPDDKHFVLWGDNKYHMYSIANMGNSKKNVHVFHDLSNPKEVCIEVNDNDKDQMRMIDDDLSQEDWSGDHFFGMRYPDTKNPSQEIRDAWQRLVTWMATNNPNAHTDELLPEPETYDNYTFRGHDRPGTQVLRGVTVTQYAGTYTHDTFERRIAKMLSECEDYMVMDSFVYHFVYLERHTMVDNVSKNNFWSSTDLIHWDLSKAYDMDTSDGNNNQGQMVFDYGNEYNDDIGGMKVFNGADSVWFVFVANLYEACRAMFTNRESAGAWSATAYHNFLLQEQQKVPERCWVQCYWYDYLRTYEDGIVGKDDWMPFLDGGQKSHQRKHFEDFEELYDSSKYRGSASTSQNINFRAYTPNTWNNYVTKATGASMRSSPNASGTLIQTIPVNTLVTVSRIADDWRVVTYNNRTGYILRSELGGVEPSGTLTVTMYNKMYISVNVGTTAWAPIKAAKNVPVTIDFSRGSLLNNTMIVVNTASMIQAISGMEHLYADTCVFSAATRLRELSLGSNDIGYENTFLKSLSLDNNTMLERLYVQNLPNANSPLDLTGCLSLTTIDATGSGFTAYSFADGGLLSSAILNRPTSLSLLNLAYLEDENFAITDYSGLISFRYENTPGIDSYMIANSAENLQIVRLIGINWIMPNANMLNRMLRLQGLNESNHTIDQSVLAGEAYAPSMRQRNLNEYGVAWPDLVVTYDNILEEFQITFSNPDGTAIKDRLGNDYIQYVDRGQTIVDPVENGDIDTPTMEPTAQYTYTYTGWQNISGAVMDNRNVIASYSSAVRTYRVRWFAQTGVLLKTTYAEYGSEVIYQDEDHVFPPTKTDEEENLYFWVFLNWDKSTGFITEDVDVYAIWDRATIPSGSVNLKDLSIAQIYGIAKTYNSSTYFHDEDYVDIKVGKDFNFSNVQSEVLLENKYFDGTEIVKKENIRLFDADAPSFTIAIDYEFTEATTNATMISCCDSTGSTEGFRVYYYLAGNTNENQSVQVLWGDKTAIVGHGLNRGILVLRHRKGSRNLLVSSDNGGRYVLHTSTYGGDDYPSNNENRYDAYNASGFTTELVRAQDTQTDSVLSFGAMAYGSQGSRFPAKGWIHWAKIWYDDLGTSVSNELASWPHEVWRMHYRGNHLYNKDDGTGLMDGASFIMNAPLPQFYEMYEPDSLNQIYTTGGWKNSLVRSFINDRCFNALPYSWQSIISPVSIPTKGGADNYNVLEYTTDKLYIPSIADLYSGAQNLNRAESTQISWCIDNKSRVRFMGITIPEDAQYYTVDSDPTLYTGTYNVKEGDVWIKGDRAYVYVTQTTADRHGYLGGRNITETSNNIVATGTQGGLWVRSITYWTRSNNTTAQANSTSSQWTIWPTGQPTSTFVLYPEYGRRGIILMFSI